MNDKRQRRSPVRHGLRHAGAVVLAIALNLALVVFMVTWLERSEAARPSAALAVPLEVRPIEPEEMELAEGPPVDEAVPSPPVPRPPLPEPEVLEVTAPDLTMPQPAPLALETADVATASSLAVPAYEGPAEPSAPPAPPQPAGGEAEEGEPAAVRPSRGPVLIRPPDLSAYYPRRARMRGTTGATRVRLTVDSDGRVTAVEVLESSPAGVFEHAARRVGRSLSFRPALREGRPVPARATLRLVWRLES
ncbi:MAG: energy transducer TonB [Phycisphaerae bacterium]